MFASLRHVLVATIVSGSERRSSARAMPWLLAFVVGAILLASVMLLAQASASGARADCVHGAISAIGPVSEDGRGDTTPEFRCIEP